MAKAVSALRCPYRPTTVCRMVFARFGADASGSWRLAAVSPRPRWAAVGLAAAGVVAGVAGTPDTSCTPLDPCSQLQVDAFGVFLGLLALSLLGLWLWPAAGALLGIPAALLDVVFDDSLAARIVFAAYGVACGYLLVRLAWARRLQRVVLDDVPTQPVPSGPLPSAASGRELWAVQVWAAIGVGVVVATGSVAMFAVEKAADAGHRERAVQVTGTVATWWDDDSEQAVTVEHPGLPAQVRVSGSSELKRGSRVPVLVDPTDPSWAELVDSPSDHSPWLSLGLLGAGAALAGVSLQLMRRRAATVEAAVGIPVEVSVDATGTALIRPVGGGEPAAYFHTGAPVVGWASRRRKPEIGWVPGNAVGDLRDWGWSRVVTDAGVITPGTPVRTIRWDDRAPDAVDAGRFRWSILDRLPSLGALAMAVVGLVLAGVSISMLPESLAVSQGGGVPGQVTITAEDCGKSCSYLGDYRSDDGVHQFQDIPFLGSGEVGTTWPAVYVGSGERPVEIYEPGNGALVENVIFTILGLGIAGAALLRRLRRPRAAPTGRHARRHA